MFERVTGFFRRFRSKRKTAETTVLGPDEAGFEDEFGFDDSEFGDVIGTDELGAGSSGGGDLDLGSGPATLSGVDTFETLEGGQQTSLSGGSGENLLEDSLPQAETFESLGGQLEVGSGEDDFGADFGDFEQLGPGEAEEVPLDLGGPPPTRAKAKPLVVLGVLVGGLVIGAVAKQFVMPMIFGGGDGIPLDQQLAKVQSDVRKAQQEIKQYDAVGGPAGIQQMQAELDAARQQYETVEAQESVLEEARTREQEYDTIVQARQEAESAAATAEEQRLALASDIRTAEQDWARKRESITQALMNYQRRKRALEASTVVAQAFEAAEQAYVTERTTEMVGRPIAPQTSGD